MAKRGGRKANDIARKRKQYKASITASGRLLIGIVDEKKEDSTAAGMETWVDRIRHFNCFAWQSIPMSWKREATTHNDERSIALYASMQLLISIQRSWRGEIPLDMYTD